MTREIDIKTFARMREAGAPVVDVREEYEFAQARVPGAQCIPLGELAGRLAEIGEGETVCVICATGNRSLIGVDILAAAGRAASSVAGGTRDWLLSGRSIDRGPLS